MYRMAQVLLWWEEWKIWEWFLKLWKTSKIRWLKHIILNDIRTNKKTIRKTYRRRWTDCFHLGKWVPVLQGYKGTGSGTWDIIPENKDKSLWLCQERRRRYKIQHQENPGHCDRWKQRLWHQILWYASRIWVSRHGRGHNRRLKGCHLPAR